jgi:hypothetical protein
LKIENIKVDNLISLEPLVNESNLIVERDLTSGQIIDYYEVILFFVLNLSESKIISNF